MAAQGLNGVIHSIKEKFSFGPSDLVGLDIGSSMIKVIELEALRAGKYKLVNYVAVPLPEGAVSDDQIHDSEAVVTAIKEAWASGKIKNHNVCVGLSGANTVARKLQVRPGSNEEIEDQVMWESEQYFPFDVDQAAVSYHVIGENEGGGVEVVVAAAHNNLIEMYKEVVKNAGLFLKVMDLGLIAVSNVFEHVMEDQTANSDVTWLLLDIGAQKTQFIVYRDGSIFFSKEIAMGAIAITEEIQRQMGVNFYEAEDLKTTYDDSGNLPEEILNIISNVAEVFFGELRKTLDFYLSSSSDESLGGCFVTGGGAQTPGLIDGLKGVLGMDVAVLNPFGNKISVDTKRFGAEIINDIAYTCVAAIGFAMRKVNDD